ncbi:family 10 glycosylhydrolase [Streptacidiphilus sp. NEAU-YB345]|uniref:Family 10 glycosylhydrolase n=1 Tax=Streptacidiphilus fuscans TaxID=2789292 RepID=A0A931FGB6_9ACTN|nr:family 10 glycosylhydrolase [Streptacidiphilus fuscans]
MRTAVLRTAALAATAAVGLPQLTATATAAERSTGAETAGHCDRQLRGEWIASVRNTNWPSRPGLRPVDQQAELVRLFDHAARLGLNAVFVQVRPTADAFWPSPFEPWSQYLTGVQGRDPGYDPLGFMVDAAHARGLALHAWFNPYRVSVHDDLEALVPDHPARRNPDWLVRYGGQLLYNPGVPAARAFVEDAILDAVARYPVDGVHFDDYFYPYPDGTEPFPDDAAFAAYGRDAGWTDRVAWRRHNVDLLVREMQAHVRAVRPEAAFGISPFGIWRNASTDPRGSATTGLQSYDALGADTLRWVRNGWVDYVAPQLYWSIGTRVADYAVLARWWADAVDGTDVQLWIGQAVSRVGVPGQPAAWQDPAELSRHLALDASLPQIDGELLYSCADVIADRIGGVSRLAADHWQRPALPPVLPRLAAGRPPLPPLVESADGPAGATGAAGLVTLTLRARGQQVPSRYAIRLQPSHPGAAPGPLVAVLPGAPEASWTGPAAPDGWTYAVTSVDCANRESIPVTVTQLVGA